MGRVFFENEAEDRALGLCVLFDGGGGAVILARANSLVVHGKYPFLCHAPGCLRSAGALFSGARRLTASDIYI